MNWRQVVVLGDGLLADENDARSTAAPAAACRRRRASSRARGARPRDGTSSARPLLRRPARPAGSRRTRGRSDGSPRRLASTACRRRLCASPSRGALPSHRSGAVEGAAVRAWNCTSRSPGTSSSRPSTTKLAVAESAAAGSRTSITELAGEIRAGLLILRIGREPAEAIGRQAKAPSSWGRLHDASQIEIPLSRTPSPRTNPS